MLCKKCGNYEARYEGLPGLDQKDLCECEPVKQEPVAEIDRRAESLRYHATGFNQAEAQRRIANYKPPVDAKAIRAEALEEAAELCDRFAKRQMHPAECAAAIRGLK